MNSEANQASRRNGAAISVMCPSGPAAMMLTCSLLIFRSVERLGQSPDRVTEIAAARPSLRIRPPFRDLIEDG